MRLSVTGASGYIGGSVAERLRDSGHEVLGLVRSSDRGHLPNGGRSSIMVFDWIGVDDVARR
jgi:nucleoside-diphosphate-sugar epimerase